MAEEGRPNPTEEVKALFEESESRTAHAFEELVARDSFGELLARVTENVVGITKIATDTFDLVLRNLRLAGRKDITSLARQLARTEDKLELVLQEVERLRDRERESTASRSTRSRSKPANGRAGNDSSGRKSGRTRSGGEGS